MLKRAGRANVEDNSDNDFSLPTEPEEPGGGLNDFSFLIHGEKKIGKTKLSIQVEDGEKPALLLQFDPPQIAYKRWEVVLETFRKAKKVVRKLEKLAKSGSKKFPYSRVVVDRADTWYFLAEKFVKEKLVIEKMNDEAYGGAWTMLKEEFADMVDRILRLPCGKWFLCHSIHETEENRHGQEVTRLRPNLNKRADEILNGKVDGWFAYMYEGKDRVLVIQGDEFTGAGHRIDGHFLTPGGKRIRTIPMGGSAEEAYQNFVSAFNNKQEVTRAKGGETKKKRLKLKVR